MLFTFHRAVTGAAFGALLVLSVTRLAAQTCAPGELRVIVKDSQEAPVFDAQVRLFGPGTEEYAAKLTQANGIADFATLPCGSWRILAQKPGFDDTEATATISSAANAVRSLILNPKIVLTSVDVTEQAPRVEQSSAQTTELHPEEAKTLPTNPATVRDALPLVPGIVRAPGGELKIDGAGEQRSTLVVNQSDVTDPATGKFGRTVPVDSVETINVLGTPFLAQYGRFTQSVVAVETKRGGEKWHADLNDPLPDFRVRSFHMRGIRNETPRGAVGGPLIRNRLYFITALTYILDKLPSRTLGFPHNESKQESVNSFTQLDLIISPRQLLTATLHVSPQHINFVNPDFFNPQPVTPGFRQHVYVGTAAHHFGVLGGTIDSALSVQRFETGVDPQGMEDMLLTPIGNRGNFFGSQKRDARRIEWIEIWSPAPVRFAGSHQFKIGTSYTGSSNQGRFVYRPVDILNSAGQLLQRIEFSNGPGFNRIDRELTAYGQDHWNLTPRLALDYGVRLEHQRLTETYRLAPRTGMAWTPFPNARTVIRGGYGEFYDHIPLDVYTFGRYPNRTITSYAADGSIPGSPVPYVNVIGSLTGPRSYLVNGKRITGSFAPRGATWNTQIEHKFARILRMRASFTENKSVGLIVLEPAVLNGVNEIVLNGNGASRYRQFEVTARATWHEGEQLVFSYTHSRARGNVNDFDSFLGNFPLPLVRENVYSNLPGDLPNRFLVWGRVDAHVWNLSLLPIVEFRNGFPYATYDQRQQYAGTPYEDRSRFPNFFSADARVMRDFKVSPKYTLRLSLTGFNLTNHFNPLAIHANTADAQYGVFFGTYHRRYRFDFEVVF